MTDEGRPERVSSLIPHPLSMPQTGRVSLVGAGPGDPGLLTLRGRDALASAEVVVYDRLANPRVLEHAPAAAERIYVGKQPGDRTWRQAQINALLIERAAAGQVVCRLKGGDPFVFGRGGEEAAALAAAGVPFEVVPGVTSAIGAPAYAGIPVTFRGLSSSVAIVAGHSEVDGSGEALRYEALARGADTLVFLMGVENLPAIVEGLLAGGRDPETPVALVRWGTWTAQETLVGTLSRIGDQAREAKFQAPAVTVVGEVVRLREQIRWFDNRPLFGRRVLVTRAREQAGDLSQLLEAAGAEPVELPLIRLEPVQDAVLPQDLASYDWVFFASTNAVACFWRLLAGSGRDWRALGEARIAAVGPATARALRDYHARPDFMPGQHDAAALLREFPEGLHGKRVLLPRAAEAPTALPEGLRAAGANVDSVAVYRNVIEKTQSTTIRAKMDSGELDAVTFASSSAVNHFHQLLPATDLSRCRVVCIGPATADTARALGIPVTAVAQEHTAKGIVSTLVTLFSR
jgi:uroporphyrinogen III methyltransferase/synthase